MDYTYEQLLDMIEGTDEQRNEAELAIMGRFYYLNDQTYL